MIQLHPTPQHRAILAFAVIGFFCASPLHAAGTEAIASQTKTGTSASSERDAVKPMIEDKLLRTPLTHQEMAGGEIDRRIMDLIYKNYMVIDLDKDWLDKFKNRTDRGSQRELYYGIGKVLDAGSLFARYTGDPKVAERNQYIMDQLRASRDADGYLGFWNVEPNKEQNLVNFLLHEQEYIVLALVRNYRATGNPQALADAKIMADYIMDMFPADQNGAHVVPTSAAIMGITEAFEELYRATDENRYLEFAKNVQYHPYSYYLKPLDAWEKQFAQPSYRYHFYTMLSHMYPDTKLYRLIGGGDYIKKSLSMKQELLERGRGMLLVTGSTSQGEVNTYNQNGGGDVQESCVTAYLLRWLDSLMRLEGDMRYGDIMERTIYNALFGAQSPDGRRICYYTAFTGKREFQTIDHYCCNGNHRRAIGELLQKVYYRTPDGGIALNLFTASEKAFDVDGKAVTIKQETSYPSSGEVTLKFACPEPVKFPFRFRVPRWCEKITVQVNDEKPIAIDPFKEKLGSYVLDRTWKDGDMVNISMPMDWRFVRGRMFQDGRVALLRGPVLFTINEKLNAKALQKVSGSIRDPKQFPDNPKHPFEMAYQQARDLIIDPTSIGTPVSDDRIRPGGQKVMAKAWTNSERAGEQVDIVLTEFVDPDGMEVYFKVPNPDHTGPIRVVDDELFSEPRRSANGEITFAWYGPKSSRGWKEMCEGMFATDGELVADLAADYRNPGGKLDVVAAFPDKSQSGSWSLFSCKNGGLLSTAKESEKAQLNSGFKVEHCPLGYAYGLKGGNGLGFFADYDPAPNMEPNWWEYAGRLFYRNLSIPEKERKQYLLTHPVADAESYGVIRWSPGPELSGKGIAISGKMLNTLAGDGVSLKAVNWKDPQNPVVLDVLEMKYEGMAPDDARTTEFIVHVEPGELGSHLDIVIGNNGSAYADQTALSLRVYATGNRAKMPGVDVTSKVRSVFQGKVKTDLGKYADLFGDPAPGQKKTLKLRVLDLGRNIKYVELPEDAPLELP